MTLHACTTKTKDNIMHAVSFRCSLCELRSNRCSMLTTSNQYQIHCMPAGGVARHGSHTDPGWHLRIRIGIHTGEPGDQGGPLVSRRELAL
jgi:hypothetical protein